MIKLEGFVRELDSRIVEYIIVLLFSYDWFLCVLVKLRFKLRNYLIILGDYILILGGVLFFGNSNFFYCFDLNKLYFIYIEWIYGIKVVIISIYINIGISDLELLM